MGVEKRENAQYYSSGVLPMQMSRSELADLILKTLVLFEFIQFIDDSYERGELHAQSVVEEFFSKSEARSTCKTYFLPLAQLKTTLSLLGVTLCFASSIKEDEWGAVGFSIRPEFELVFVQKDSVEATGNNVTDIIVTMRNASAHLPDIIQAASPGANVSFDECCVSFASWDPRGRFRSRVTFRSQRGFVLFLRDYIPAVKKLVRTKLLGINSEVAHPSRFC